MRCSIWKPLLLSGMAWALLACCMPSKSTESWTRWSNGRVNPSSGVAASLASLCTRSNFFSWIHQAITGFADMALSFPDSTSSHRNHCHGLYRKDDCQLQHCYLDFSTEMQLRSRIRLLWTLQIKGCKFRRFKGCNDTWVISTKFSSSESSLIAKMHYCLQMFPFSG